MLVMAEIVKKLRCKLSFRPSLTEGITSVRARLHGGGGPQVGEVTRLAVFEKICYIQSYNPGVLR